jgi:hypothetical protein
VGGDYCFITLNGEGVDCNSARMVDDLTVMWIRAGVMQNSISILTSVPKNGIADVALN